MVDIDPGLDAKLRELFEHIEASAPPSGITDIDVANVLHDRGEGSGVGVAGGI